MRPPQQGPQEQLDGQEGDKSLHSSTISSRRAAEKEIQSRGFANLHAFDALCVRKRKPGPRPAHKCQLVLDTR